MVSDAEPAGPAPEPSASEAPANQAPPVPTEPLRLEPMSFTGAGSEYFRIWIVNLALSIVTLGIYSAWAKVRRLQYFFRHTRLAGAGFDYHGNPVAILRGRVVGLILFGLYSAARYVNAWMMVAIFVALAAVMPWLLGRSLRFRLHNSSYRGIRFKFHGTTRQAYWVFLALPALTVLSLFTLVPFCHQRIKRYQLTNAAFGRSRFSFATGPGDFYFAYMLAGLAFAGLLIAAFTLLAVIGLVLSGSPPPNDGESSGRMVAMFGGFILIYILAIVSAQAITAARIRNAVWGNVKLEQHEFISEVSAPQLFGILFTNLLATVMTLGLFRPFAQVRLARYLISTVTLVPAAGLDSFAAAEADDVTAAGEETADFFDLDIAF